MLELEPGACHRTRTDGTRRRGGRARAAAAFGAAIACAAASTPALADTIVADRPGFLFSDAVLEPGRIQIELGLPQYEWAGSGSDDSLLSLPAVVRIGVAPSLEVQVGHSPVNHATSRRAGVETGRTGVGDLGVGLKLALGGDGARMRGVLAAAVTLPVGDDAFTAGEAGVSAQAQVAWTSEAGRSVGALVGYAYTPSDGGPADKTGTLAAAASFPVAGPWGTYVEIGYFPGFAGAPDTAFAGWGVTRLLGERIQLDAFVNRGLTAASADWVAGTGFSLRF